MLREQPQELDSRVPRAADDSSLDHVASLQKRESRPEAVSDPMKQDAPINVSSTACAASPCAGRPSFAPLRARSGAKEGRPAQGEAAQAVLETLIGASCFIGSETASGR